MLITKNFELTGLSDADFQMFPELGGLEEGFPADDLLEALSAGLEIPQLLGGEGSPGCDESPDDIIKNAVEFPSHNADDLDMNFMPMDLDIFQNICPHGLDSLPAESDLLDRITEDIKIENEIKLEPRSPRSQLPPSPSPSHSDSSGLEWQNDSSSTTSSDGKFMLETPPISPPQSEPASPPAIINSPVLQQIKLYPIKSQENTSTKFLLSKGNSAKRVCIQPRVNKTSNKSEEQPRKTIILSAQDFAALSQKVKQNGSPQLKIQTLPVNKTVKIQNQLNILPSQQVKVEKGTTFTQTNQVKIINAIPKGQIQNTNSIPKPIVIPKDPAVCTPIVIKDNPSVTPIVIKNEISEFINLSGRQESEIKAMKRQQRMIKNRESACLSRKKKKEYVTSLENQISHLQEQNRQLQAENAALKQRLCEVEELTGGRSRIRNVNLNGNKKNTVMLLAVLCIVSFNFSNFGVFQSKPKLESMSAHMPLPSVRHSRSLLWTEPDSQETNSSTDSFNKTSTHHPMCPMYINQTESIRLDFELRRWIGGDSDRDNWTKPTKTELEVKSLGEFLLSKPSSVQKKLMEKLKPPTKKKLETKPKSNSLPWQNNAVEVFSPILREHAALFDALRRKDDTFYVVWFSGEHLLLPASRQNNTVRPKMSLVFPALPLNETLSAPPNHVTMMQIDCEVTNTQLLHLQNSVIPEHLRNQRKPNSRSQKARAENYKPYFLKENYTQTFNHKNFEEPYILRGKDYNQKDIPYIIKDKFEAEFHLDEEKYDPYVKSKNIHKREEFIPGANNFYEEKLKKRKGLSP